MLINFGYFEGDGNALELDSYDYYTTLWILLKILTYAF